MTTLIELCAGSAALTRHLTGAPRLLGYAGGKDGYAEAIAETLGLERLTSSDRVMLCEAPESPWWYVWLCAERRQLDLVATNIEAEVDAPARELWERLRGLLRIERNTTLGWPLVADFTEVAAWELLLLASTHGGHEIGGFKGAHRRRPSVDGFIPRRETLAARVRELASTMRGDFPELRAASIPLGLLAASGSETTVYIDPPYVGTTGYLNTLSRADVVEIATHAASVADVVAVSEREPLDLGPDWESVEITDRRRGQSRRKSATPEWLTIWRRNR